MFTDAVRDLATVRDWLRFAVSRFNEAGLAFGHGNANAHDEAAYLTLHTLHLPIDQLEPYLDARLLPDERARLADVLRQRVEQRRPAAYITGESWLQGYRFQVDERVIVPRSFLAPMVLEQFYPWLGQPDLVRRALDLCTGSGCLAILLAEAFPDAEIDAVDLSEGALEVARNNVRDYGLEGRINLLRSDLFTQLSGWKYDLIVTNPPYVDAHAMALLPPEYRHEPEQALASGEDGLDAVRAILRAAPEHLNPGGLLAVELGHNRDTFEAAFPGLEVMWPDVEWDADTVFLVHREQLTSGIENGTI